MKLADILLSSNGTRHGRAATKAALDLAARSGARVLSYYVPSPTELPVENEMSLENPDEAPPTEAVDAAEAEFDRLLQSNGVEGEWALGNADEAINDLARYARNADIVVVSLGDPDDPSSDPQGVDVEKLVMACGRPVLGIPVANVPETIGRNVMVAWDGSREATRALHDAVPLLHDAQSITIASIDIDPLSILSPANAVEHLRRMGINAKVDTSLSLDLPIGEEILSRVDWEQIDLLVAGAFGHRRLWEHLFGGPSMTLIHQMMVPVLLSH